MAEIIRGSVGIQASLAVLIESTEAQRDLALASLIEQKIINRHLAEVAGATFGEDDIEIDTN